MLEICLYLSNLKTYENVVYLSVKYKDRSTKWDVHFKHSWRNYNKNKIKVDVGRVGEVARLNLEYPKEVVQVL